MNTEAPREPTVEIPAVDVLEMVKQQFTDAQDYIKLLLQRRQVTPKLANGASVPLPVDQVEFLTGVTGAQYTLDLRVSLKDLRAVGERLVVDTALDVLKNVPVLARTFNFDPGKSDPEKPSPVGFSWGPDRETVDIKFVFPKEIEPADVIQEILAMRQGELLAASAQPSVTPAAVGAAATAADTLSADTVPPGATTTLIPPTPPVDQTFSVSGNDQGAGFAQEGLRAPVLTADSAAKSAVGRVQKGLGAPLVVSR